MIREKWIFQFDEDDDTWDEVYKELGIEIDDRNTSEAEESGDDGSGNISDVSTVNESSDGRSETNGNRNVPSTSTFGSTGKREKKTRQRSTS